MIELLSTVKGEKKTRKSLKRNRLGGKVGEGGEQRKGGEGGRGGREVVVSKRQAK